MTLPKPPEQIAEKNVDVHVERNYFKNNCYVCAICLRETLITNADPVIIPAYGGGYELYAKHMLELHGKDIKNVCKQPSVFPRRLT